MSNPTGKASVAGVDADETHIKVAVRCRPMSEKEISDGHQCIVEYEGKNRIVVHDISESPSDHLGTKSGERRNYSHVYDFNAVFDCNSNQLDVYNRVCRSIVDSVLEGYNGTILAYGQTGTGKTYTMEGAGGRSYQLRSRRQKESTMGTNSARQYRADLGTSKAVEKSRRRGNSAQELTKSKGDEVDIKNKKTSDESVSIAVDDDDESTLGIIPRAFKQIFDHVAKNPQVQFLIRASYLEIYQEEIHDLLRKDRSIKLELHERPDVGVYVKDLTSFVCKSMTEIERVMRVGNQNRMVGATDMNEHSSRSHAIFMITVEQQLINPQEDISVSQHEQAKETLKTSGNNRSAQQQQQQQQQHRAIRVGKLNLVDLAGSERQRKTNSFGQRQRESIKINLSLSALGNVINSLMKIHTRQQQQSNNSNNTTDFTPYRDSKLTRLLQDSLGGNAKTLMIANIGPASYNYDETINTLNYASRAKCIRNKPRLNEDPKDALLRELQRQIDELRSKLAAMKVSTNAHKQPARFNEGTKGGATEAQLDPAQTRSIDAVHQNERVERELTELRQKLSSLESKLLNGVSWQGSGSDNNNQYGSTTTDQKLLLQGYTNEQELELERRRQELANQAGREKAIRDELERREEAELLAKQSFGSIQQEVDAKKRLIRQILLKIKSMRDEMVNTQKAYSMELDELDQLQYVLQKELKLKCLIMDNFIPNSHVDQLLPRISYDDKRNCCSIMPIDLPLDYCNLNGVDDESQYTGYNECLMEHLNGISSSIRPRSEFEKIGETIYPSNIRYKYENLIEPKLELPKVPDDDEGRRRRLLRDRVEDQSAASDGIPIVAPQVTRIQSLIDSALSQREADIVI